MPPIVPPSSRQSIFAPNGDLRVPQSGTIRADAYIDLGTVDWSPIPGYGFKHGQDTSRLAKHVAEMPESMGGFGLTPKDSRIIEAAAMLHDAGRMVLDSDPGHYARSADIAYRVLTGPGNGWTASDASEAARLVMLHGSPETSDVRLKALQDADRLETCRFDVKGRTGLQKVKDKCKPELFHSGWAKDPQTLRVWMGYHGWL